MTRHIKAKENLEFVMSKSGKRRYDCIPFGQEHLMQQNNIVCDECGAYIGEFHEPGCDLEECPKCGCQLLSCACNIV